MDVRMTYVVGIGLSGSNVNFVDVSLGNVVCHRTCFLQYILQILISKVINLVAE